MLCQSPTVREGQLHFHQEAAKKRPQHQTSLPCLLKTVLESAPFLGSRSQSQSFKARTSYNSGYCDFISLVSQAPWITKTCLYSGEKKQKASAEPKHAAITDDDVPF